LPEIQAQRGRDQRRGYGQRPHYRNYYGYRNNRYYNRGWSYGGYRYNGWHPGYRFGGPRVIIPYRGINFHYFNGYYYRPFGTYWRMVPPPVGLSIAILPGGYRRVYAGGDPYYYYGGAYYRELRDRRYEVVDAPLGASVPELPEAAKVIVINGEKLYELDGTYYKEEIRDNSEIWYTVVGRDGKLDTAVEAALPDNRPANGTWVDKLPDNCKTVVISGNKYFVSPDGVYYEEVVEKNTIRYRVTGK
jgi:hypothetical protein